MMMMMYLRIFIHVSCTLESLARTSGRVETKVIAPCLCLAHEQFISVSVCSALVLCLKGLSAHMGAVYDRKSWVLISWALPLR